MEPNFRPGTVCQICQEYSEVLGHNTSTCPKNICKNCGKNGHVTITCPSRKASKICDNNCRSRSHLKPCLRCGVFIPTDPRDVLHTSQTSFIVVFKVKDLPIEQTPKSLQIVRRKSSKQFKVHETVVPLKDQTDIVVTYNLAADKDKLPTESELEALVELFYCMIPKEEKYLNNFLLIEVKEEYIHLHFPDGSVKKYKGILWRKNKAKAQPFLDEVLDRLKYPKELVLVARNPEEAKACLDTLFLLLDKDQQRKMKIWFTISKLYRHQQVEGAIAAFNKKGIEDLKEMQLKQYAKKEVLLSNTCLQFIEVDFRCLGNAEKISDCTCLLIQRIKCQKPEFEWYFRDEKLHRDEAQSEEKRGIRKFLEFLEDQTESNAKGGVVIVMKDMQKLKVLMRKLSESTIKFKLAFAKVEDREAIKYPFYVKTFENYREARTPLPCLSEFSAFKSYWKFKSWSSQVEKISLSSRHVQSSRSEILRSRRRSKKHLDEEKSAEREDGESKAKENLKRGANLEKSENAKLPKLEKVEKVTRKVEIAKKQDSKVDNESSDIVFIKAEKPDDTPKLFEIKLAESAIFSDESPTGPWKVSLPKQQIFKVQQSNLEIEQYGCIAQTIVESNEKSEAFVTVKNATNSKFHLPGAVIGTALSTEASEEPECSRGFVFFRPVEEGFIGSKRSKWVKLQGNSKLDKCLAMCHAVNVYSLDNELVPRLNNLSRYVFQDVMSIYLTNVSENGVNLLPSKCVVKAVCNHGHYENSQCFSKN